MTQGDSHFRMKIILGPVLIRSRFSLLKFRDVAGTIPEQTRECGFWKNSSSLDKARKMRLPVLLNSWDNFFVTLPSIFSDNWVIKSSQSPREFVFLAWMFLGWSLVFYLFMAAYFLLFLRVAILEEKGKNNWQRLKTELMSFILW